MQALTVIGAERCEVSTGEVCAEAPCYLKHSKNGVLWTARRTALAVKATLSLADAMG